MSTDRNSYSKILNSISLFGGVKIIQIAVSIIRSKIIALFIGPLGMGMAGLLSSTIEIVSTITNCGLQTSAVRDVSKSFTNNDKKEIGRTVSTLRLLVWGTGCVGMLLSFIFSSSLSSLAFGSEKYSLEFKILSIVLLLNQLSIGQMVVLQGTFHYKELAKASLFGSLLGLVLTAPLYYYMGMGGIVPGIIISACVTLFFSWYFSKRINTNKVKLTLLSFLDESRSMLNLGLAIALSSITVSIGNYLIRIILSKVGSIEDVGFYTAGMTLANSYVFLVLSSMSSDYTPRLSSISHNKLLLIEVINKQGILLVTLVAPLILVFMVFIKQIIILLYSAEFLTISRMIEWLMLGMLFRVISWSISYSLVARGDSKIFFWNEFFITTISIGLTIIGYLLLGFTGIGIAFLITYGIYTIQMLYISKKLFSFHFNFHFYKILIPQLTLCIITLILINLHLNSLFRYAGGTLLIGISIFYSYKTLDERIGIKSLYLSLINKIHK